MARITQKKAAEIAADLALLHSADLRYVHVLMRELTFGQLGKYAENAHLKDIIATEQKAITDIMTSGRIAFVPGASEAVVRQLAEIILLDAEELGEKRGVKNMSSVVLDGHPPEKILGYCEENQADMLIVGTRGLSGIKDFFARKRFAETAKSFDLYLCVRQVGTQRWKWP